MTRRCDIRPTQRVFVGVVSEVLLLFFDAWDSTRSKRIPVITTTHYGGDSLRAKSNPKVKTGVAPE